MSGQQARCTGGLWGWPGQQPGGLERALRGGVCGEGRGLPRTCLQSPGSPGATPSSGSPGRTQERLQLLRPAGCSRRSVVRKLGRRLCGWPCVFSGGGNTLWPCEVLKGTERIKGTGGWHEQATMCGRSQHAGFLQMADWHRVSSAHLLSCSEAAGTWAGLRGARTEEESHEALGSARPVDVGPFACPGPPPTPHPPVTGQHVALRCGSGGFLVAAPPGLAVKC